MRVVVDTNVLLTSVARRSDTHWLFDAVRSGRLDLCVSTEILLEYEEVIGQRAPWAVVHNLLNALAALPNVHSVSPAFHWRLIHADPDDDKFVDAALAGNAEAIVTHDAHFDVLARVPFPRIAVVTPETLQALLGLR